MKRRTNLFYNGINDTNRYLTFSNWTESLTGCFLSTDTKIFPSTFLCMNIDRLKNESDRNKFIKEYLVGHYENKMSYMRDWCSYNGHEPESYLTPLKYLIETIGLFNGGTVEINYVDNITEQDWNGTFTDTICVVDSDTYHTAYATSKTSWTPEAITVTGYDTSYLYGWYSSDGTSYEYNIPSYYASVEPTFDNIQDLWPSGTPHYYYESKISDIGVSDNDPSASEIQFNVVIPLYTVVNSTSAENASYLNIGVSNSIPSDYSTNVPMGIWFSGDDPVVISRADEYYPTWSLVIGAQFKPFPLSDKMPTEITKTAVGDAFGAFAQVLSRQNKILNEFDTISDRITNLCDRVSLIESKLNMMSTSSKVDALTAEIELIKSKL